MYVDSRKVVQINLFPRQEQRHRCRYRKCGHGDEGAKGVGIN